MRWSRKPDADLEGLALSSEEGFVLSRLETALTHDEIVELTGLPQTRIDAILALLEDKGIVASDTPSFRPAMETIPDAEFDGTLPADDEADTPVRGSAAEVPVAGLPVVRAPVASAPAVTAPDPLREMLHSETLADLFILATHNDVPEASRVIAGDVLREKYVSAPAEDRAALICSTEGHALTLGIALDGRTTTILCSRPYNSVVFVRQLARFATCPPVLLAHLARQPLVKRDSQLRQLLLRHPNMPNDAKRRG